MSLMADVIFLPAAEADYQAALAWYRARSPQATARFEAAVVDALQRIADNSDLYGLIDDRQSILAGRAADQVPQPIAPEAERVYRENSRRGKENAYVTVRVRAGDAALDQLYIDNQPLPEYLRAQAAKK